MKLKEQNHLLEFHLLEVRESLLTIPSFASSLQKVPNKITNKPKTTDDRRDKGWGINSVSLDPGINSS